MDLREGIPADPISAVDFPFPHAKMIPNNHPRHAIALGFGTGKLGCGDFLTVRRMGNDRINDHAMQRVGEEMTAVNARSFKA